MPMTPAAAKKYKPRREPGSLDDVVYSDTKKAAMDEAKCPQCGVHFPLSIASREYPVNLALLALVK